MAVINQRYGNQRLFLKQLTYKKGQIRHALNTIEKVGVQLAEDVSLLSLTIEVLSPVTKLEIGCHLGEVIGVLSETLLMIRYPPIII